MPKFTVLITTYGRFEELKQAVKSVQLQSFNDYEIVLVDDNQPDSNNGSLVSRWIGELDQDLTYIKNTSNIGANRSRNRGIDAARGEYIAFLDDDDQWYPQKLDVLNEFIKENEDADLIYSDYDVFDRDMNEKLFRRCLKEYNQEINFNLLKQNYLGPTSGITIRNFTHKFLPDLEAWQDYHFYLQFVLSGNIIGYINFPLFKYRKHEQSISNRYHINDILDKIYSLKKKIVTKYNYEIDLNKYRKIDIARFYFYQRKPFEFIKAMVQVIMQGGLKELVVNKLRNNE